MYTFLIILHIIFSLFLIVAVLLQSGKGAATANIFGGGGAENVFGAQTSNVLNRATSILATGFIVTSLLLTMVSSRSSSTSIIKQELQKEKAPISQEK